MINGVCFTNLDCGKGVEWPESFVAIPNKGDYVEAIGAKLSLRVVAITHFMSRKGFHETGVLVPCIRVELNR